MKTKEELDAIKTEVENLSRKLKELTEDELKKVAGGDVSSANIVGFVQGMMPYIAAGKETDEQIINGCYPSPEISGCRPDAGGVCSAYKKDIGSDKNAKVIY